MRSTHLFCFRVESMLLTQPGSKNHPKEEPILEALRSDSREKPCEQPKRMPVKKLYPARKDIGLTTGRDAIEISEGSRNGSRPIMRDKAYHVNLRCLYDPVPQAGTCAVASREDTGRISEARSSS